MGKLLLLRQPQEPSGLRDEALVAACGVGDSAALGALFERYYGAVYCFLSRLVGANEQTLDDLAQATFLEVHRSASTFRGGSQVKTWIFGIASNMARHHIRSEVRQRAALSQLSLHPSSEARRPDELTERRQMVQKLSEALSGLPHDLRVAFVLCDLEQIPGAEAAKTLGVPEGTLSRRLCEARKALREVLR